MFQLTTLENGLTIATDSYNTVETLSLGVFVRTGSRAETLENHGVSHFLEHMAFKGTQKKTAFELMAAIEDVGGDLDAYTSRDSTVYLSKVLKEDMPLAVDLLADIVQNSKLAEEDIVKECQVILQEFKEAQDTPSDILFEDLQELCYPNHPLGRSILGTEESIKSITSEKLRAYIKEHYTAENMMICAAGNVDHEQFVAEVTKAFASLPAGKPLEVEEATYVGGTKHRSRPEIQQAHSVIAYEGMHYNHPLYYASQIWNNIIGGSMTSRMFQKIREEQGLAYAINSFVNVYKDTATFGVYAATEKSQQELLKQMVEKELQDSIEGITEQELMRARTQFKAGLMMYLESTDNRMVRVANNLVTRGRYVSDQELIEQIESVTLEQIKAAAKEILAKPQSYATVS